MTGEEGLRVKEADHVMGSINQVLQVVWCAVVAIHIIQVLCPVPVVPAIAVYASQL